tara:strand:- start:431 stop:640 length:210 start_codon:yes stop_codon:yes gene_type:complete
VGVAMSRNVDEVSKGLDAAIDTVKALVKVLIIEYNDEITDLLKESIMKSQEIEALKKQLKEERNETKTS